jgi:transposase InsO family protein
MIAVTETLAEQIGVSRACDALDVARSTLYRARQPRPEPKLRPTPSHALTASERAEVREVLNSERFMDSPPRQVYAALLDEGRYLASVSTMYRVLREHGEVRERRAVRQHPTYTRPELLATAPNQVWSWDITVMRGPVKWAHFALYTVLDIFSRYVVGWMIAETQTSELARQLVDESARKQGIQPGQLTLHSDNGTPMKGQPLVGLLDDLGIDRSHSRPHTSDDNPFSEAQFKTMKYRPDYPDRFADIDAARRWARTFFAWYNHEHYHSGLNLLTPASVHYGEVEAIRAQRQATMAAAYAAHPQRFAAGLPQVKAAPEAVWINPPAEAGNLP